MDARAYFRLTDGIASAQTEAELAAMRDIIAATAMHPTERRAVEGALRRRAMVLRGGDAEVPLDPPLRADQPGSGDTLNA